MQTRVTYDHSERLLIGGGLCAAPTDSEIIATYKSRLILQMRNSTPFLLFLKHSQFTENTRFRGDAIKIADFTLG